MCGICCVHNGDIEDIEEGLKRLVYRGYDSWGFASADDKTRKVGVFDGDSDLEECDTAVGHTRWATHGQVNEKNTHPHSDCSERFQVVHNGTLNNWESLKHDLVGHTFDSETDTEVIAHLIESHLEDSVEDALEKTKNDIEGNYAVVVLDRQTEELHAIKRRSPLVYARSDSAQYFASDVYAISQFTDRAYIIEDGETVSTTDPVPEDELRHFEWTEEKPQLGGYDYWMTKEIYDQPDAMRELRRSLRSDQAATIQELREDLQDSDRVIFVGSGTSYHSTLIGAYLLNDHGINAQTLIASEFENYERINDDTTVVAVSQSGETRDVINAINHAKSEGATVHSMVNVPLSTIQRKTDLTLEIRAGQENCVAATKTFTNQIYAMMHLVEADGLGEFPNKLSVMIEFLHDIAETMAHDLRDENDFYIIGEDISYPVAREIALKLKEIAYIHAEGMMAGELKHGTLALVEEDTQMLALNPGTGRIDKTISEVESRGAEVSEIYEVQGELFHIIRAATFGFFLAAETGRKKNLPVDKPRNLAKSVTVE